MSCLEKQYASHKAGVRHPFNLDSFMDETDREVMNLTDRAFKSLCIGDEAIYNDSELVPSLVDCHKPLVEEKPKKPRENSSVKKHGAHRPNGVYNTPWQTNKNTSNVSSLFAALTSKKSNDMKMTNGDSWDKSALLSIQTELSEFSSDYQNHLLNKDFCQNKSHRIQDVHKSSGKSKNQHSKSTKLRKLNSKNFFLHSEFSPFQSWGDLNRFGLENMGLFRCSSPAGLYDSPLYTELENSNTLPVPKANKRETSQSTSPREPGHKSKHDLLQKIAPPVPEKPSELKLPQMPNVQIETLQPQVLLTSSGSFQRCQSEGDLYAPWRKNRSRAKGTVQPLISSPDCERANPVDECAIQKKKEVKTVEEPTCLNSTPFNILQLLTPIIPSRQGTGTSDILQAVHSPAVLDIPGLHETEIRPSPDIKREGYKSKASGLLFNLKDNRKRVKATYSPPKFKGLDAADQNKLSPLIEQDMPKDFLQSPEIADAKTASAVRNTDRCPMSPKTADTQSSQSSSHIKSALPDDFLGLSLLHAGSPVVSLKAKRTLCPKLHIHLYICTENVVR
ncbi:cardiac-enriched FHL2-interacting protein [Silurus meridionalis]|nr:cardiac-enriched FHL2-interacting protein [Silurus meridionalis]